MANTVATEVHKSDLNIKRINVKVQTKCLHCAYLRIVNIVRNTLRYHSNE